MIKVKPIRPQQYSPANVRLLLAKTKLLCVYIYENKLTIYLVK